MKINKYSALTVNTFLISPLLSIPLISYLLAKNRDSTVIALLSMIYGFLSMKYVPHYMDDKTRYIERYELFINYSIKDFVAYLESTFRPDFLFDLINFIFAQMQIHVKFFFFFITSLTLYSTLTVLKKIIQTTTSRVFVYTNITVIALIISISVPNLLSGIRFYFAGSIFLWFIYHIFFEKNNVLAIILAIACISTHFSYLLLLVSILPVMALHNIKIFKYILCISFIFFLLPIEFIDSLLSGMPLPSNYENKVDSYTNSDRTFNENFLLLQKIKDSWYYLACVFLLMFRPTDKSLYYRLIVSLFVFTNITYSVPYAFGRYLILLKIIFAAFLINLLQQRKISRVTFYIFLSVFFVGWYVELYVIRYNLEYSYSISNMWSLYHILFEDSRLFNYLIN